MATEKTVNKAEYLADSDVAVAGNLTMHVFFTDASGAVVPVTKANGTTARRMTGKLLGNKNGTLYHNVTGHVSVGKVAVMVNAKAYIDGTKADIDRAARYGQSKRVTDKSPESESDKADRLAKANAAYATARGFAQDGKSVSGPVTVVGK